MSTVIVNEVRVEIPEWVTSLAAFRRWTDDPDFPEKGNIWWLSGKVWVDMSQEQLFSHLKIKGEFYRVLENCLIAEETGHLFPDGLLLTNEVADISGNPDLTYISHQSIDSGRVVLVEGKEHGYTEVLGSADMVLEAVSTSSVEKDTEILRTHYFQAGVQEYWLVDAREDTPSFEILKRGAKGFVAVRKQDGWMKSQVFGKSFRLTQSKDARGFPKFRLEVK